MRRVKLSERIARELRLWSVFSLDAHPTYASAILPRPLKTSRELKASLEGRGAFELVGEQVERQIDSWRDDSGLARLSFTSVKNKQQLLKVWDDESLWESTLNDLNALITYQSAIDALISQSSLRWKLPRMGAVDRAILRLGTYELCFKLGISARSILNESIELGKRYGSADSSRFINGVLDRIAQDLGRVDRRVMKSNSDQVNVVQVKRRDSAEGSS